MAFRVRDLPRAEVDRQQIATWLAERSPVGARAWLNAYDDLVTRLEDNATIYGKAIENEQCDLDIHQAFFKTGHGRVYRVIFHIEGHDVFVLRVRGPGQSPVEPDELR